MEKRRQALQEQQRKEQERLAALEREEQERKVPLQQPHFHKAVKHYCVNQNSNTIFTSIWYKPDVTENP